MSRLTAAAETDRRPRMSGRIRRHESPLRPLPTGLAYREFVSADRRRVFVHREVLEDLAALERAEHPNETAGLLFGRIFTDGSGECALVRHLIRPEPGEVLGTPATVTITTEGSSRMSGRAQERYPCADAVGWAHTHPTFKAYFSSTDRAEQSVWTSPASVGLVVSGLPDAVPRFEVFVGPESTSTWAASGPSQEVGRSGAEAASVGPPGALRASELPVGGHSTRRKTPTGEVRIGALVLRTRELAIAAALACILIVCLLWLLGTLQSGGSPSASSPLGRGFGLEGKVDSGGAGRIGGIPHFGIGLPAPAERANEFGKSVREE
jgi:proteasome lid subunit RPN8/RPN11